MIVVDRQVSLVLTGTGDVLEPESGIVAIGSGGNYALAAARALADSRSMMRRRSRAGRWRSPPRSASSPTTSWWSKASQPENPNDRLLAA